MVKKATRTKKKEDQCAQSIPVYDARGKEVETLDLDKDIFTGKVHEAALYQSIVAYNANQRHGTASTKTTTEVSGGGKKPWAQKGTGRARHGSIRSPLWRGGGIIFGPHPRDYRLQIPKKVRRLALISGLNVKLKEKNLLGVATLAVEEPKTKRFKAILDALKAKGKTLFIVDTVDEKTTLAARNLREVTLRNYKDFNLMDLLAHEKVVVTKDAFAKLSERLKAR